MAEQRAIRVSHELWQQIMTQGYVSGGVLRCVEGIPEGATLTNVFYYSSIAPSRLVDPVFVFASDHWSTPPSEHTIAVDGEKLPIFCPVFRVTDV